MPRDTSEESRRPEEDVQPQGRLSMDAAEPSHFADAVLYDLALGALPQDHRVAMLDHLANCDTCIEKLVTFQEAIATDRKVYAIWKPDILHAAGADQPPSIIRQATEDEKYLITLQPARSGEKDLLTIAVASALREHLEDHAVTLVSHEGNLIFRGTISGGTIIRIIERKWREELPFSIRVG